MSDTPFNPPMMKSVLLVDDNDRYARFIAKDLMRRNTEVIRARSAKEAILHLKANIGSFDGIVTDMAMEHQISGLSVLFFAIKMRFKGAVATASTGLDSWLGYFVNRLFLGKIGCQYLIPKQPIKQDGTVIWIKIQKGCWHESLLYGPMPRRMGYGK